MKSQALGNELPGLRAKAKSPQRLTKSFFSAVLSVFIFTVCLKLMTWSRLVTMETRVIYLPLRSFSTDRIRAGFLMQSVCLCPSFSKWICGKRMDYWNWGIWGNILKEGALKTKQGLEEVWGLMFLLTSMSMLIQFSPFGMLFPIQNGDLLLAYSTVQSPPSTHQPSQENEPTLLLFLAHFVRWFLYYAYLWWMMLDWTFLLSFPGLSHLSYMQFLFCSRVSGQQTA